MRRHLAGGRVGDQRLDARQAVRDEQRDVAVSPELAQDGLGVPQDEVRLGRPCHIGMRRGQRPALDPAAPPPRRPHAPGAAARRISSESTTASPRIRRHAASTAAKRAATSVRGDATAQDDGDRRVHQLGVEVEEGRDNDVRLHRTHGRRPRREVTGPTRDAEALVGLCGLGHEVHHAVQRLERAPRLACPQRPGIRRVVTHRPLLIRESGRE